MKIKKLTYRAALFLLLAALILALPSPAAQAVSQAQIDALEEQRDQLRAEREEMQAGIDALRTEQAGVLEQKLALDAQNDVYRQEIELIDEQLEIYTALVEQKAREVEEATASQEEQLKAYRKHVRSMEEDGSYTYLALIFGSRSISELIANLDMIGEIMQADKRMYDQYTAAREDTERVKAEYEEMLDSLGEKQSSLEQEKAALEVKIEEASALVAALEAEINENLELYEAQVAQEAALESNIQDLIAQFEQQEAAKNIVSTGSYIWPLPGYKPGSAYGWRLHPILGVQRFHSGEDIGAPSGTPILAADSGMVILAGVNGGYGNCVMIDHGGGRVTLYAHMSSFAVSYGQSVTQGDTVGYVGSTGLSTGPHLHFEVRVNGATTDPKQYFSFS